MGTTRVTQHVKAPRAQVYRALLDDEALPHWKVPNGMTCEVHAFDAREGGHLRVSLTYDDPARAGKTAARTDTYRGTFTKLVENELVVEVDEFETDDTALRGAMTITYRLVERDGGTDVVAVHEGLPDAVKLEDNELGWRMSLGKLAQFVEAARGA
jgi:uncharacterized protein YndB with AHSA1/START domain